ncbi:hypothetical protein [Sporosarcina highlanderae]|uniref:Lipoprotein n=1 Tax=Sporosarcina highlanderae TaxID=3035916 RepID=A0ABT8JPA9_9BACL|nr:hypothetical protein [Sporosarcina highlanderae]MDN4606985.1 hypothetical protein [Sporosarcina highlanderae]
MFRLWKFLFLTLLSITVLSACGKTLEEQAADGIAAAKTAFELNDKVVNDEVEDISLYKPAGFTISKSSNGQNIIMKKGDETFLLFINPNEKKDSRLFYDLMERNDQSVHFEKVFTDDGYFSFASVLKKGEDQVELITSVGGIKMTTITKKKNIESNMAHMMEIVRSIEQGQR